jgi:glycerol-3-phosphate acyltransferase PlsY
MMTYLFLVLGAYVLGSVPFGLIAGRLCGVDPRKEGSGNTGATNLARTCGLWVGILVLVLDFAKGFLPAYAVFSMNAPWPWVSLVGFAALFGHCYSVFLGFRGGKAVATTLGVFAAVAPLPLAAAAVLCVGAIAASGFVSLGSLVLVTSMPLLLLAFQTPRFIALSVAVLFLVYWRHRENIGRLVRGEEKPWRSRKAADKGKG